MRHTKNVRPALFCRIDDGSKTFLVADNDTGFQLGDTVLLKEFDEEPVNPTSDSPKGYTGNELEFGVGYVLSLGVNNVVFSLLPLKPNRK